MKPISELFFGPLLPPSAPTGVGTAPGPDPAASPFAVSLDDARGAQQTAAQARGPEVEAGGREVAEQRERSSERSSERSAGNEPVQWMPGATTESDADSDPTIAPLPAGIAGLQPHPGTVPADLTTSPRGNRLPLVRDPSGNGLPPGQAGVVTRSGSQQLDAVSGALPLSPRASAVTAPPHSAIPEPASAGVAAALPGDAGRSAAAATAAAPTVSAAAPTVPAAPAPLRGPAVLDAVRTESAPADLPRHGSAALPDSGRGAVPTGAGATRDTAPAPWVPPGAANASVLTGALKATSAMPSKPAGGESSAGSAAPAAAHARSTADSATVSSAAGGAASGSVAALLQRANPNVAEAVVDGARPAQPAAAPLPPVGTADGAAVRSELAPAGAAVAATTTVTLDRRALLEAAGRQRVSRDAGGSATDAVDRSPGPGGEAGEPRAQTLTQRAVLPVFAPRDLSALAERIEMLSHRRAGSASVNLKLGELGDVGISVRMESRQAHVQFVVQDAAVREALESQLPRLRALLAEGGLDLGDVAADLQGRGDGAQRQSEPSARASAASAALSDTGADPMSESRRRPPDANRLLDAFA